MSLVFSAITPNSPLVLENVAKEESEKLDQTKQGLKQLEQELYLSKPETIILISEDSSNFNERFAINMEPEFESDFTEFGDVSTQQSWDCDTVLATQIEQEVEKLPFQLTSRKKLSKDSSVPMHFLGDNLDQVKILPVSVCELSKKPHVEFGEIIGDIVSQITRRVAVIASGNLSHKLSDESPAGFHDDAAVFDNRIKKFLKQADTDSILKMDEETIDNADEYIYNPLLVMLGILNRETFDYNEMSYEQAFGTGHLVANLQLP
ncbi:MAG: hypothetical protein ABEJ02_05015 [Candidatus Paceibacteria bacterium]